MISAKLLHVVLHRLQLILGYIELAEQTPEEGKRKELFDRSRHEIDGLAKLLKEHRGKK